MQCLETTVAPYDPDSALLPLWSTGRMKGWIRVLAPHPPSSRVDPGRLEHACSRLTDAGSHLRAELCTGTHPAPCSSPTPTAPGNAWPCAELSKTCHSAGIPFNAMGRGVLRTAPVTWVGTAEPQPVTRKGAAGLGLLKEHCTS